MAQQQLYQVRGIKIEDLDQVEEISDAEFMAVFNAEGVVCKQVPSSGGVDIPSKTYEELKVMIANNELIKGQKYRLSDYMTTYIQPVTEVNKSSGIIEVLILTALSSNLFSEVCQSELYPQDIVYYLFDQDLDVEYGSEGFTKGKIYRRIDTERNNDIGSDWRHVKYDREGVDKLLFEDYQECKDNKIKSIHLANNVVGYFFQHNEIDFFENNTIEEEFASNKSRVFVDNKIGKWFIKNNVVECISNVIGDTFNSNNLEIFTENTILSNFTYNTAKKDFGKNYIGNHFVGNNVEINFLNNTVADHFEYYNFDKYFIGNNLTSPLKDNKFLVSNLPMNVSIGQTFIAMDILNPTYNTAVSGGGNVIAPVFFNGTSWISIINN